MIRSISILIFILISFQSSSQVNIDSLLNIWQDESQSDSIRATAYSAYILEGFLFSNPDTAYILAEDLHRFAYKSGYKIAHGQAHSFQGISWSLRDDYPKALDHYSRSLKVYEQLGAQKGTAIALHNIGMIYQEQGDYPRALDHYSRNLKISEHLNDLSGIASSLNNIGIIYQEQGDYTKALDHYTRGLKIYEQLGDQRGIGISLNNIGVICQEQGDYTRALDHYSRSLEIYEQMGNQKGIGISLNNIGVLYRDQGDNQRALDHYSRSLKIRDQIGDQSGMARSLRNIGIIYRKQGNYPMALDYCQRAYKVALAVGILEEQKGACQCLYDTYKGMGKGNEALIYIEKIREVEDSLKYKETTKKLEQMEFAKQVFADSVARANEARLIEEAHKAEIRKKNQTRNRIIAGGLFILIIAIAFYSRWRIVRKSRDEISREKDRSENLLLNILPAEVAQELKDKGRAEARDYDMVSILFTDFVAFTQTSEKLSASELVEEINACFEAFDRILEKYNIEKIKTIGDAYMAAGGLPVPDDASVKNTVLAAMEMQTFILKRKAERDAENLPGFQMRVGIHTGPVVAGIVGVKKFQYDIWGDTVNTASRMENNGESGKINISGSTYDLLKNDPDLSFISRGKIDVKGKGQMEMFFVEIRKTSD